MNLLRNIVRWLCGAAFIGSGVLHFTSTDSYAKIVPPMLPAKSELVYISGLFEILGGIALIAPIKSTRKAAMYGLIALLVAVFPANVYHAVGNVKVEPLPSSPFYHAIRLPMQGVLIWLVWWSAKPNKLEVTKSQTQV